MKTKTVAINCFALTILLGFTAIAQAQTDSVFRTAEFGNKQVRGKIVKTTPIEVTVETRNGQETVPAREIKKITFSNEPRSLNRARDHFEGQRFDDCLQTIQKIDGEPKSRFIKQEMDFLAAVSDANKALRGDRETTTQTAEQAVASFIQQNSDSYRLVQAIDVYAQLLMANGKTEAAQKQFNKLTKSRWPKYIARGHFFEGENLVLANQLAAAEKSYRELAGLSDSDPSTKQFKQLAECQLAKLAALQGDVQRAVSTIENIIKNENAENSRLFAYAYNALGTCYLQSNELKKACRAFLHTELLFSSESDAHAEALYNLAKIWPKLKEVERANRARELLSSRYRNSIWASKL